MICFTCSWVCGVSPDFMRFSTNYQRFVVVFLKIPRDWVVCQVICSCEDSTWQTFLFSECKHGQWSLSELFTSLWSITTKFHGISGNNNERFVVVSLAHDLVISDLWLLVWRFSKIHLTLEICGLWLIRQLPHHLPGSSDHGLWFSHLVVVK